MIGALTIATKPQGIEWDDFEVWWKKLSPQEKSKAMSDFVPNDLKCGCPLEDANEMTMWDNRITVVDQFPLFRNIPRDSSLSRSIRNSWIILMRKEE